MNDSQWIALVLIVWAIVLFRNFMTTRQHFYEEYKESHKE